MMATAPENSSVQPGHLQDRQDALEKRLKDTLAAREDAQTKIKTCQDELNRLFRDCPSRPQDTVEEIDQRMAKLERERTIVSMPLREEKAILKQIHKLERTKQKVQQYLAVDAKIKAKKAQVATGRQTLRATGQELTDIRNELSTVRTANQLGCRVEDLLGMKVPCPEEKIGHVIGKKGKNIQQLSHKSNVTVDIGKADQDGRDLRIVGSMESLDAALLNLDKVISKTEESFDVSAQVVQYLTAKGVDALTELRQSHPDVRMEVQRKKTTVRLQGIPSDIQSCKDDFMAAAELVTSQTLTVTSKEASMIVGKQGSTIEALVASHQTAIDVSRRTSEDAGESSTITLIGPSGHVDSALREIRDLLEANRETERVVAIEPFVKSTLLLDSGKGIQALFQQVNDTVNDKTAGFVGVNFSDKSIVVKGKQRVLDVAVEVVEAEIRRLELLAVRLTVDPETIPIFIGKGGQGIKALKGDRSVTIELDREVGEVVLCGLEEADVKAVEEEARALAQKHIVKRIAMDPSQYKLQIKEYFRSKSKEVNALCHSKGDDEKMELVLRGSQENLEKATGIIEEFIANNYYEELEVTEADVQALLTGGKNSKISELANETGVNLTMDRDQLVMVAKGEKEKVSAALKMVRSFLYGGEGISLVKIPLEKDVIGMVIGKGGKHRTEWEKKYESLSIMMGRSDDVMTLRGADEEVNACRLEIMKLIATARVTEKLTLTEAEMKNLEKTRVHRRLMQTVPVHVTIQGTTVSIRGLKDDVRDAVASILEQTGKPYSVGYYLEDALFRRVKETWKDPTSLKRIERSSGAKISLEEQTDAVVFTGKRASVRKAKKEVLGFFEFLFAKQFGRLDIPQQVLVSLGKSGCVAEAVAQSGARIIIDRDIDAILVFGPDAGKVKVAIDALRAAIEKESKLVYVLQLETDEDWLVPLLLGRNGNRIKALRKQTECKLDMHSRERRLTISAEEEEKVAKAKETVKEILEKARKECAFVTLPDNQVAAFVGRAGAHINEFSEKHGVEVQLKKGSSTVRLTGKEDAVLAAKLAVAEWSEAREERRQQEQASVSITLHKDQIPAVIGPKGAVIRSLEKEFRCRIDVDRKAFVVAIRGAKREEALERVKQIANEDAEGTIADASSETSKDTPTPTKKEKKQKDRPRRQKTAPEKKEADSTKGTSSLQDAYFPTLTDQTDKVLKSNATVGGSSWASMLKSQAETNPGDEEVPEIEIKDDSDGAP